MSRADLERRHAEVERSLKELIEEGARLTVVQAPPGSGKTSLLVSCLLHCWRRKMRVAVGAQTNAQADDICERIARQRSRVHTIRFASYSHDPEVPESVVVMRRVQDLPPGPCVVVSTIAKWDFTAVDDPYDFLIVDEAWQMAWSSFMPCQDVSGRFVLIGDPGQIPPVVTVDTSRWETAPRPPHRPTPDVILQDPELEAEVLSLPGSRRLPMDSVPVVRSFYDFHFDAWASEQDRVFQCAADGEGNLSRCLRALQTSSISLLTLPTPELGPPLELDEDVGRTAADLAVKILGSEATLVIRDDPRVPRPFLVQPEHIGISATHRVVNAFIERCLPETLRGLIRVDTPERWQGLERPLMIVIHPLSGVTRPSAFDLDTGRLCVMASRHRIGLIVVTRDHVGETIQNYIPAADQAVGCPDITGRGHSRHEAFWRAVRGDV